MLPITTANYVDLKLNLSPQLNTALSRCYLGAVLLLLTIVPPIFYPLSYLLAEALWFEWQRIYLHFLRLEGPLRIYHDGQIRWHNHAGHIIEVKLVTRWLVVMSVAHRRNQWLVICYDSCDEGKYRQLKMMLHLGLLKTHSLAKKP